MLQKELLNSESEYKLYICHIHAFFLSGVRIARLT